MSAGWSSNVAPDSLCMWYQTFSRFSTLSVSIKYIHSRVFCPCRHGKAEQKPGRNHTVRSSLLAKIDCSTAAYLQAIYERRKLLQTYFTHRFDPGAYNVSVSSIYRSSLEESRLVKTFVQRNSNDCRSINDSDKKELKNFFHLLFSVFFSQIFVSSKLELCRLESEIFGSRGNFIKNGEKNSFRHSAWGGRKSRSASSFFLFHAVSLRNRIELEPFSLIKNSKFEMFEGKRTLLLFHL